MSNQREFEVFLSDMRRVNKLEHCFFSLFEHRFDSPQFRMERESKYVDQPQIIRLSALSNNSSNMHDLSLRKSKSVQKPNENRGNNSDDLNDWVLYDDLKNTDTQ